MKKNSTNKTKIRSANSFGFNNNDIVDLDNFDGDEEGIIIHIYLDGIYNYTQPNYQLSAQNSVSSLTDLREFADEPDTRKLIEYVENANRKDYIEKIWTIDKLLLFIRTMTIKTTNSYFNKWGELLDCAINVPKKVEKELKRLKTSLDINPIVNRHLIIGI